MKTKILAPFFTAIVVTILFSSFNSMDVNSLCDSPLVGDHSGAPGETNCTYCHAGTVNTGSGLLGYHVGDDSTYVPSQTYTCTVKMAQGSLSKFGFVNLALKNSSNTTIGTFNLVDSLRTRKYTIGIRNYLSHTPCGADADTLGRNYWYYTWTAPASNVGVIKLYISGLAANHDEATTGDDTYTKVVTLNPSSTGINEIQANLKGIKIYPNPSNEFVQLSYENLGEGNVTISILNLQGKLIKTFFNGEQSRGQQFLKLNLRQENISNGLYLMKIETTSGTITSQISIF